MKNQPKKDLFDLFFFNDHPFLVNALIKWYYALKAKPMLLFAKKDPPLESLPLPISKITSPAEDDFFLKSDIKFAVRSANCIENDQVIACKKILLESIIVCNSETPMDSLTMAQLNLETPNNIDEIISIFNGISEDKVFKYNLSSVSKLNKRCYNFSQWFDESILNSLSQWIVFLFERKITLKYEPFKG